MFKKDSTKILLLALAVIGLAVGLSFLSQKKVVIKKATASVNVRLSPATATKNLDEEFAVNVNIEAGSSQVSGIDLKISFDKDKLQVTAFTNAAAFPTLISADLGATTGNARLVAVNTTNSLATGTFIAGTLTLKGKAVTGATPSLVTINTAASQIVGVGPNNETVLPVGQTTNGAYTIVSGIVTPTATPTPVRPTNTPTLTLTPMPTPIGCGRSCDLQNLCPAGFTCRLQPTPGATKGNCRNQSCPEATNCVCPVTPTPAPCPGGHLGDINCDRTINLYDLNWLVSKWGTSGIFSDPNFHSADIVPDNRVNMADLVKLLDNWLLSFESIPTPTPR